jgi:hypothetical protein
MYSRKINALRYLKNELYIFHFSQATTIEWMSDLCLALVDDDGDPAMHRLVATEAGAC